MRLLVVTATLGLSPHLRDAIESVRAFAPNARHIVVTPAGRFEAVRTLLPGIEVRKENEPGVFPAIGGILNATESWDAATWINDDDRLEPGFCRVVESTVNFDPDDPWVVYGNVQYIDKTGRLLGRIPTARSWCVRSLLFKGRAAFSQQGAVFSRGLWLRTGGFDQRWRLAGDHALWLHGAESGARFFRVPVTTASFRLHRNQLTSNQELVDVEMKELCADVGNRRAKLVGLAATLVHRLESLPHLVERRWRSGVWSSRELYRSVGQNQSASWRLIHPLTSGSPSGMGVAASGLSSLLVPAIASEAPRVNRWFRRINDCRVLGSFRLILRFMLSQFAPLVSHRDERLIFSSHHAPLWGTGRHIVIVYDLIALRYGEQARMQHAFYRYLLPRVLRSATVIVTISRAVRDELNKTYAFLADRQIHVIPAWSAALEARGTTPVQKSCERDHVLVVGARYPHKNLSLVLDAMARIAETGSKRRLVVAGVRRDLWNQRESWRLLEEKGLLTALEFPSDQQLSELYGQARCLVYPSLAEGQGLPPLEALKRDCPVICSDIPVLRETCDPAAFFVSPHDSDALATLLSGIFAGELNDEVEAMRRKAPEILERFSAREITLKWRTLLGSLA